MANAKPLAKFTVTRDVILPALMAAGRVASGKVIPVIGCVHVDVQANGTARWWATDTDLWSGGEFPVEVEQAGVGLLPVQLLVNALKACAPGPVTLTLTSERVTVTAGRYSGKFPVFPIEDSPEIPLVPENGLPLPRALFAAMLRQADSALAQESAPAHMRGALLIVRDGALQIVTTDGHRMAILRTPLPQANGEAIEAVIPSRASQEVVKLLEEQDEDSLVYDWNEARHVFRVGSRVLIARTFAERFPTWDRLAASVAAGAAATRIECDREAVLSALARVSVALSTRPGQDDVAGVRVECSSDGLTLKGQSADRGDAVEVVPAMLTGADVQAMVKARYLREFLAAAATSRVAIEVRDPLKPLLLQQVGDTPSDYRCVLMGMRL